LTKIKITTWRIKTKHNNQNHRRILAIVDLIVYLMPIRPRGDPEVLVVRGKPTGPTGSLLHDRASLYSSTHFFNFTKKNKTKTKQNFVYRFSKSVNKTADKSQKDNECVSNLQQYNFFASKIENQKRKKLHEAMPPQIVLVNKQLILMC